MSNVQSGIYVGLKVISLWQKGGNDTLSDASKALWTILAQNIFSLSSTH